MANATCETTSFLQRIKLQEKRQQGNIQIKKTVKRLTGILIVKNIKTNSIYETIISWNPDSIKELLLTLSMIMELKIFPKEPMLYRNIYCIFMVEMM